MSWIRCSEVGTLLVAAVLLVAAAGTATAFTVSASGVPSEAQVGSEVSVTYTIDDPYTGVANDWTLRGSTDLRNVSWTVTVFRAGTAESQEVYSSQSFEHPLSVDNNGDQVEVEITGDVPPISNYTYRPAETFQIAKLDRVVGANAQNFRDDTAHHYTTESRQARLAIEDAEAAIDRAGGHQRAESLVDSAISSYNSGNFGNAENIAGQAESAAAGAAQTQFLITVAIVIVLALLLIGGAVGGFLYWKNQQDDYSKL